MRSFSLKAKMLLLSGVLALAALIIGVTGITTLQKVSRLYLAAINGSAANTILLKDMRGTVAEINWALNRTAFPGISQEEQGVASEAFSQALKKYLELDKAYNEIPFVPGEAELYDPLKAKWVQLHPVLTETLEQALAMRSENRARLESRVRQEIPKISGELYARFDALIRFNDDNKTAALKAALSADEQGRFLSILFVSLGFLGALSAGILFSRALVNSIQNVAKTLSAASEQVAQNSDQIAKAAEELSQASNEQAASLQETSSSVEELTSMVAKNSENARSSAESARQSLENAQSGKATIQEMVGAIQELEQSNQRIAEIVKVFTEIQEKTKVIEDIVFQTQLLSFNASVEAARAGEHGKGFAVVAEEVGNLAEMSGNASGEITGLLSNSLKKVESTVEEIRSKINRLVSEGGRGIEVLEKIVQEAHSVNGKISEIAAASQEQTRGIQEISKAITQLDQATQQNAATSEEAASSAEALSGQAGSLRQSVQTLLELVEGAGAQGRPSGARDAVRTPAFS